MNEKYGPSQLNYVKIIVIFVLNIKGSLKIKYNSLQDNWNSKKCRQENLKIKSVKLRPTTKLNFLHFNLKRNFQKQAPKKKKIFQRKQKAIIKITTTCIPNFKSSQLLNNRKLQMQLKLLQTFKNQNRRNQIINVVGKF